MRICFFVVACDQAFECANQEAAPEPQLGVLNGLRMCG